MTDNRKRTTITIPRDLDRELTIWGRRLGTGRNSLIVIAVGRLLADMSGMESHQKRRTNLKVLRRIVDEVFDTAERSA